MIKVEGLEEALGKIEALPDKLKKKTLLPAIRKGARVLVKEARARAPVGDPGKRFRYLGKSPMTKVPHKAGNLKRSIGIITTRRTRRSENPSLLVGPRAGKRGGKNDGYYGGMVEFGTKKSKPTPYMRPAFEAKKEEAKRIISEEIVNAARKLGR